MAILADLPELVGFFSYSRDDDEDSHGALSAFRDRIQKELRGQLGRSKATFKLWQDTEMIGSGTQWETEIKKAVAQSVFFIPIITPTVVQSRYCRFELEAFLDRESALDRDDLVFPIVYIRVPGLEDDARQRSDPVLSIVGKRQWLDWRDFRHRDVNSPDAKAKIERFCQNICDALDRPWVSPEERKELEEAAARERAEAERARQHAEAKRQEEEQRKQAEALALARSEEEKRRRAADAERQRAEADRLRAKLEADRRADDERLKLEAEAKRRAEADTLRVEADAKRAAEQRLRAEEDARRKALAQQREAKWWAKAHTYLSRPQFFFGAVLLLLFLGVGLVVVSGISQPPTSPPPQPTPSAQLTSAPLRFDGVYQNRQNGFYYYLRFYDDNNVVFTSMPFVTTTPPFVYLGSPTDASFNKQFNGGAGHYRFPNSPDRIEFSIATATSTIDFDGTVSKHSLSLSVFDHSNGQKTTETYTFEAW
jgi:hypothetical protein